jgi:hypothetical protein
MAAEITGRMGQIKAAADAAAFAMARDGGLAAALAVLDEIREQAARGRRDLKAAIGGRTAPAVRPGALCEKILAPERPPRQRAHPARDPQGPRELFRGDRQCPGQCSPSWVRPSWPPRNRAGSAGPVQPPGGGQRNGR